MSGKNQKNRGTILMRMFYPDRREKSAYTIDYADLYRKGYRGVIFDIDNTLVPHGAPATKEAAAFFASLRETGFSTCLLSNNQKPRVAPFADAVGSIYIENAHKPSVKNYQEACRRMGIKEEQAVFVGDQLHRCVRCKTDRTLQYSDRADQSERGNSDRSETVSGAHCTVLL